MATVFGDGLANSFSHTIMLSSGTIAIIIRVLSMFNQLGNRLTTTLNRLRGVGRLTESNIKVALREVKRALLEADVALPVVNQFLDDVNKAAVGQAVIKNIRPGEALIKIVHDELITILGGESAELNLKAEPPIVYLMVGLQGSGKTTTAAKLARWLKTTKNKSVLVTSADIYRPAAIDQLARVAEQVGVDCFPSNAQQKPTQIARDAIQHAKKHFHDVVIIDTAGRLHVDDELMAEVRDISSVAQPTETLLVVDSMTGQDAANVAKAFSDALNLTGVILTKVDGDARGGAALSMRMITHKPIKMIGTGEKLDALEAFHPQRIASRILGMGDILSLVEEAQQKIDHKQAAKLAQKVKKGKRFDFNDFLSQLKQMRKMGGLAGLMSKLPMMPNLPKGAAGMMDEKLLVKMEAMICSMTLKERSFPALINGSRKQRIAKGSGTDLQDVNKLLKQFTQMQKMLKRFKGDKMAKKMKNLQGQLPPELLDQLPPDWQR